MDSKLSIGDITIEVVHKKIKHAYLRVDGSGAVRMSAPRRMSNLDIEAFARSKLGWIQRQQSKLQARPKPAEHRYVSGERFTVWGRTVYLGVVEHNGRPSIELHGAGLRLAVRPGTNKAGRQALLERWYRAQLEAAVPPLLARWEPVLGVKLARFSLRKMKTRWGSCSTAPRTIRLNTELARLHPECLEYVVVHELVHLLEPSHNAHFKKLMDNFLPGWRKIRGQLNQNPIGCEG